MSNLAYAVSRLTTMLLSLALACPGAHAARHAVALQPSSSTEPEPGTWEGTASSERPYHWSGQAPAEGVVEVESHDGSIRAEPASDHDVAIDARARGDGEPVRLRVERDAGGIHVHALDREQQEVDIVVRMPAALRFLVHTANGPVRAEGIGAAEVHAVNGRIELCGVHHALAHLVNGSIRASFASAEWAEPVEMSTVNGSIEISLPAYPDVTVEARTMNGDVSLALPAAGIGGGRAVRSVVGRGDHVLRLRSVNGRIHVQSG